jgi:hypothetical protein
MEPISKVCYFFSWLCSLPLFLQAAGMLRNLHIDIEAFSKCGRILKNRYKDNIMKVRGMQVRHNMPALLIPRIFHKKPASSILVL